MDLSKLLYDKTDLDRQEILYLFGLQSMEEKSNLYKKADAVRRDLFKDEIQVRGLIEFSNYCSQNCIFCRLRDNNFSIKRYRMSPDEIIDVAKNISSLGIKNIFLQSGEDTYFDTDLIAYLIYTIKQNFNQEIILNIGLRGFDEYKSWKLAGADRYVIRIESTKQKMFGSYRPKKDLESRLSHIKFLRRIGFKIEAGMVVGLPKQSLEDLADDLIFFKRLNPDSLYIQPFLPAPFTPLQTSAPVDSSLLNKTIAIARLSLRNVNISFPAMINKVHPSAAENALNSGANVVRPNFTPISASLRGVSY